MTAEIPEDTTKTKKRAKAIREPAQARSRETMDNILSATEALLAEKPFDKITMQEIAQRSGAGVSSIYARFRDKQALILGLHARLRENVIECVDRLADPARWEYNTSEEIVSAVVPPCVRFYRVHGALIRAALTIDEPELRERQASVLRIASSKFSALIAPRYPDRVEAIEIAVDGAVRIVASVMYVSLLFQEVDMSHRRVSDHAMARMLVHSINGMLEAAEHRKD